MFSREIKPLDLGDYRRFELTECLKEKSKTSVLDEGGLSSPLSVSLVIPTKFEPQEILEIEEVALQRILSQCSKLIDNGYLDEIIIMGATLTDDGKPDFSFLQKIVKVAYNELGLFKDQVDMLNRYRSQNERAKRGHIDFFLKVVHQFDPNLPKLLAKYGVFGVTGYFGVLRGKGYGLWLSVPITQGNIICFVDADVMNFEKEFVAGLCHPIVYSWNVQEAAIQFVKACYNRVTITKTNSESTILGGRINRLLAVPLLRSVTDIFKLYLGLESIRCPLAGEFAVSRDLIEQWNFPNSYAVETSLLFQTYDLIGPSPIAQLDLGVYRHIGQPFESLESMAYQIVDSALREVSEKVGRPWTTEEKEQLLVSYTENAMALLDECEKTATSLKTSGEDLVYSRESDMEMVDDLKKIIEDVLAGREEKKHPRYFVCPSWKRINERIENYFVLREMLRRRTNQSTWSRLREAGLLTG